MRIAYTTREAVRTALDSKNSARNNSAVDRAIRSASDTVEGFLRRRFYPELTTRYIDWPTNQGTPSYRVWLDENELIDLDTMTSGGTAIASGFELEPKGDGPPYYAIELDLSGSASFTSGSTFQNSIVLTGTFGYRDDSDVAGALAEALDNSETGVDVTNSAAIGVGSVIKVGDERMQVTDKTMLDSTQNIGGNLTAVNSDVTVPVTTGSAYFVDEVILVDAERMLIVDIAGNNLIVQRAYDGTVLATHTTGADVYAPRTLTVVRGVLGTTAAAHDTAAAISRWVVPPLVEELCIAETLNILQQRGSAWAREVGSGDSVREASGRGIAQIRKDAWRAHGRKIRLATV